MCVSAAYIQETWRKLETVDQLSKFESFPAKCKSCSHVTERIAQLGLFSPRSAFEVIKIRPHWVLFPTKARLKTAFFDRFISDLIGARPVWNGLKSDQQVRGRVKWLSNTGISFALLIRLFSVNRERRLQIVIPPLSVLCWEFSERPRATSNRGHSIFRSPFCKQKEFEMPLNWITSDL